MQWGNTSHAAFEIEAHAIKFAQDRQEFNTDVQLWDNTRAMYVMIPAKS